MSLIGYKTAYDFYNSLITPKKLVEFAVDNNYDFVQCSDLHNLAVVPELYNEAKIKNIKFVVGTKVSVSEENTTLYFSLYPKNIKGYYKVVKLINKINLENYQTTLSDITNFVDDVIPVLLLENISLFDKYITFYQKLNINPSLIWLGVNLNEEINNNQYTKIANYLKNHNVLSLPLLLSNTVKPHHKTSKAFEVLTTIGKLTTRPVLPTPLLNKNEIALWKKSHPYFFEKILDFTKEINFDFSELYGLKPLDFSFPISLSKKCKQKLKQLNLDNNYEQTLDRELKVINKLGLDNYFLLVSSICETLDKEEITRGPGRGSSNASLVCYLLGINKVDPLKYDLFFERFLNEERSGLPDIDIDIDDSRRNTIINYLKETYQGGFCQISVYNHITDHIGLSAILKLNNKDLSLASDIISKRVNGFYEEKQILSLIENLPQERNTHPAGVILTSLDLSKIVPLTVNKNNYLQASWGSDTLAKLGFIKTDLLSLSNLQLIDKTIKQIKLSHPEYDNSKVSLEDTNTYKALASGDTSYIFQLEGAGITKFVRSFQPKSFRDLYQIISLYRPGSLSQIDTFLKNKEDNNYSSPYQELKKILGETYGVIVFQEQIIQIASTLAGFSLSKSDIFRRAISQKDESLIFKYQKDFITGLVSRGISKDDSKRLFNEILEFANYGFNKAHAVAYAMLSYQTAFLKTNYPLEYYSALFQMQGANETLLKSFLIKFANKNIAKPDINYSEEVLCEKNNSIVIPLSFVRKLSLSTISKIIKERNENGFFKDYQDFKKRCNSFTSQQEITQLLKGGFFQMETNLLLSLTQGSEINEMLFLLGHSFSSSNNDDLSALAKNERDAFGCNIFYSSLRKYLTSHYKTRLLEDSEKFLKKEVTLLIKNITLSPTKKAIFITLTDTNLDIDTVYFATEQFELLKPDQIVSVVIKENNRDDMQSYIIDYLKIIN